MTDHQNFSKSTGLPRPPRVCSARALLTSERRPYGRSQRRLIQPAFFRERILSCNSLMTGYTLALMEGWRDGEVRDLHADMMRVTLGIAARSLFSVDIANDTRTIGASLNDVLEDMPRLAGFSFLPSWIPIPGLGRFRRAVAELDKIVYGIIRNRRATGERCGDLLDMLLEARYEDGSAMPDQQLRDEVMTLLLAEPRNHRQHHGLDALPVGAAS